MKTFASQIYSAAKSGKLQRPFNAKTVKEACPGWAERTYFVFLPKHRVGNGKTTELFKQVSRGMYDIIDELQL